jgi:chaperonin GroEL
MNNMMVQQEAAALGNGKFEFFPENNVNGVSLTANVLGEEEARKQIDAALTFLADKLSSTLGPYGTTTLIQSATNLQHFATKDGYSVLREIAFMEAVPATILDLVKRISFRLVRTVGDGSTTAVVASKELYSSLKDLVANKEVPPKDILDALNIISDMVREDLKANAVDISNDKEALKKVAFVSTNNDSEIADIIAKAFDITGVDGTMIVSKGTKRETVIEQNEGIEIKRGMINPFFATKQTDTDLTCEMDKAVVFMCDGSIGESEAPIVKALLDFAKNENRGLLFIAKGFAQPVQAFLQEYKLANKGQVVCAVDIPTSTFDAMNSFSDIATFIGATPFLKDSGEQLQMSEPTEEGGQGSLNFDLERLGVIDSCKISVSKTTMYGGRGNSEEIAERVAGIKESLSGLTEIEDHIERDERIHMLRNRIANLSGGMVNILVGGNSVQEINAKADLVEDAVYACQSAARHGITIGGSLAVPNALSNTTLFNKIMDAIESKTSMNAAHIEPIIMAIRLSFEAVYQRVINHCSYAAVRERLGDDQDFKDVIGLPLGDIAVALEKEETTLNMITDRCVQGNDDLIFNAKTLKFESLEDTSVINSIETDYEVLSAVSSIIGLIITSNQFVSGR